MKKTPTGRADTAVIGTSNIADLARRANLSKATVSRYLNGRRIRSPGQERLAKLIQQLGYVPNRLAQGLKSRRSMTLALVMPNINNPFFPAVIKGAEDAAHASGYHLLLANTGENPEHEWERLRALHRSRVDGYLLIPTPDTGSTETRRRRLESLGVPIVFVDRAPGFPADLVASDNVLGAEKVVDHLCRLGHKRIALLTATAPISTHREREEGYRRALARAGLISSREPPLVLRGPTSIADGLAAMQAVLKRRPTPTAVFTTNNHLAMGAVAAILKSGMRCPGDISLVTFDDPEWADIFHPRLTAVAQPTYQIGQQATALLLRRIRGDLEQTPARLLLDTTLIIRESCGVYRPRPEKRRGVRFSD